MSYINLLNIVYPVGSLYCSTIDTSPAEIVGGTWSKVNEGYYIMGAGSTYQPTIVGGNNTITLATTQIPSHAHVKALKLCSSEASGFGLISSNYFQNNVAIKGGLGDYTGYTGGGQAHSNMPAYYPLHMWVRTS